MERESLATAAGNPEQARAWDASGRGAGCAFLRREPLARRRSAVVVDAGATGLRAAQCEVVRRRVRLRDVLRHRWSASPADESGAALPLCRIARAPLQGDFAGDAVTLLLSPPTVQFHALSVPDAVLQQPPDRLHDALRLEVSREARVEPGDIEVRHWLLPSGHRQRMNVMAISIPAALVRGWVDSLAEQAVCLRGVLPLPCAHVRAVCTRFAPAARELWGLLDLGAARSTFTAVIGATPCYVRNLSAATQAWRQRLASALDVDAERAGDLLFQYGLSEAHAQREAEYELRRVLADLLRDPLNDMVRDLERCFAYLLQSYGELEAGRIFVAGGGALVPGVCEFIELLTGMRTEPIARGDERGDLAFDVTTAGAVGGALLEVDCP